MLPSCSHSENRLPCLPHSSLPWTFPSELTSDGYWNPRPLWVPFAGPLPNTPTLLGFPRDLRLGTNEAYAALFVDSHLEERGLFIFSRSLSSRKSQGKAFGHLCEGCGSLLPHHRMSHPHPVQGIPSTSFRPFLPGIQAALDAPWQRRLLGLTWWFLLFLLRARARENRAHSFLADSERPAPSSPSSCSLTNTNLHPPAPRHYRDAHRQTWRPLSTPGNC